MLRKNCTGLSQSESSNFFMYIINEGSVNLRTLARNFSNTDFFLKILALKDDELVISEM